jgi:hypothetical protein
MLRHHYETGGTKSALDSPIHYKRQLDGVRRGDGSDSLDGENSGILRYIFPTCNAGTHYFIVQHHIAYPALTTVAAALRASQMLLFPNHLEKRRLRIGHYSLWNSVDGYSFDAK